MRTISNLINKVGKFGWPILLGIFAISAVGLTWASSYPPYGNIELFDRFTTVIKNNYITEVDDYKMLKAGIDGILSQLDPYSRFLVGPDYADLVQETEGEFEGIGIGLEFHHDSLVIISVQKDSPAFKSGLAIFDKIIEIDGVNTKGKSLREIRSLLRGQDNSEVKLRIARPDKGQIIIKSFRKSIHLNAVAYYGKAPNNIGYIKLTRFSEDSSLEIKHAIESLIEQNVRDIILDLRGNPGGLVEEAAKIAGYFIPENMIIVETRGRDNSLIRRYKSNSGGLFFDGDLALIVDSETASAAEIVAGAIQDHDRGVIIGTETFGKGLVQQVMKFSDDSALKLTTSKYILPSGRCLQQPNWTDHALSPAPGIMADDSAYTTDTGRFVFGEGGIVPDIYIEKKSTVPYVEALKQQSYFFDFASRYLTREKIESEFRVNDRIMVEFENFIKLNPVIFESESEKALETLISQLNIKDGELIKALKTVDYNIKSQKSAAFNQNYNAIARELQETIFMLSGRENDLYSQIWIPNLPEIREAISILSSDEKYGDILSSR